MSSVATTKVPPITLGERELGLLSGVVLGFEFEFELAFELASELASELGLGLGLGCVVFRVGPGSRASGLQNPPGLPIRVTVERVRF